MFLAVALVSIKLSIDATYGTIRTKPLSNKSIFVAWKLSLIEARLGKEFNMETDTGTIATKADNIPMQKAPVQATSNWAISWSQDKQLCPIAIPRNT